MLVIGIIILVSGYFYYENLKIKNQLLEYEYKLNKLSELVFSENVNNNILKTQQVEVNDFDIQMGDMKNNLTESFNPIEGLIHEIPKDKSKVVEHVSDDLPKDLPLDGFIPREEKEKDDNDWSNIDKQMKDDTLTNDENNIPSDPVELESFNVEEMLKDISDENNHEHNIEKDDEKKSETTDKIIDISGDIDYKNMTVSQLKDILVEKNLPVSLVIKQN